MNVMTTEIFDESAGRTADASVQKRDAALARLMKAWESKSARAAKRAGGLSLVAVSLAACNDSNSGSSSNGDGTGGEGGDGGETGGGDVNAVTLIPAPSSAPFDIDLSDLPDGLQLGSGAGAFIQAIIDQNTALTEDNITVLTTDESVNAVGGTLTSGDDAVFATSGTLHLAFIDAGAGTDALSINADGSNGNITTSPYLVRDVETVEVNHSAGSNTIDLYSTFDIETLSISQDAGFDTGSRLSVTGVRNSADVTFSGTFSAPVMVNYTGGTGAINITLKDVTASLGSGGPQFTVAHESGTVNLISTDAIVANIVDNADFGDFLQVMNISGDAPLQLGVVDTPIDFRATDPATIDASEAGGPVTIFVGSHEDVTFTGTEGSDTLGVSGVQIPDGSDAITLNAEMGAGSNTLEVNTGGDTTFVTSESVIESDGTVELVVTGNGGTLDLTGIGSADGVDVSGVDTVMLEDGTDLSLTTDQFEAIGADNMSVEASGNATLSLDITEDGFNVDDLNTGDLPEGLSLSLSLQSDVDLEITGEQLLTLLDAGVSITDDSGADTPGTINITGFTQANLEDEDGEPIDFSSVLPDADIAGTITTDGSELFVPEGAPSDVFGDFAWDLEGGTLGISDPEMADGLVVNGGDAGGDLQFYFTGFATGQNTIDASDYTDINKIFVNDQFRSNGSDFNVESITSLDQDTEVDIVRLQPLLGSAREVVIGGAPFAIDEDGAPFNPLDEAPVSGPVVQPNLNLVFNNQSGNAADNIETVKISFNEGGNEVSDIEIGAGSLPNGNAFETLTLISNGDDVNTVQNIFATSNTLTDVDITASEAFDAQTITLSSLEADADGVVTVSGSADVTLKAIDISNADVDTLTVETTGHTGTLDITGGSPSIDAGESLVFEGGADSTVMLDTDGDPLTPGIQGNATLTSIDASAMAGTLNLGQVENVAEGFTLTGGEGTITANVELPVDNWSLDIGDAAAGSAITFGGEDFALSSGSFSLATDPDSGETTLTFGDDTELTADATLFLGGFDNVVFGSDVTIELSEGGFVSMDDDTYADFVAANGEITGDTAKTFDSGNDLTDLRGLTEVNIEEGSMGTFTLSSDQIANARIVDADGNPVSDTGDIQALNDEIDLAIEVKEGETFTVTDNQIDDVAISGDGSVVTNIEGIAGAQLTLDPVSDNNDPGQSITVDYTLDGAAGSVTLNNTATSFISPAAINAALASTLGGVSGLNAGVTGGVISVQADEPGVEFAINSVDTSGTNGADISAASNVESEADMSGNTVADTTHVFAELTTGGYQVTGTLGGDQALEIEADNFIDLSGATFPTATPTEPLSINVTGDADLKVSEGDLADLIVTGDDASVQADVAGSITGADLSGIDVPLQFNVDAGGASLDGATLFNSGQPLTLIGPESVAAPGPVFDITGLDTAGNVPSVNRPSSVDLDNVDLTLTAAQADGLVVTGSSEVTVDMDSLMSDNSDLSGVGVDLEITSDTTDLEFGGNLPDGQPITISGGNTVSLNGNTIPAAAVVSVAANTTLDVTGGTLGADVSFVMEAGSVLNITGAQADGTSIEGAPDGNGDPQALGSVDITGLDGTQDLSGIDGPSLALTFEDDAVEGSVAASAIDGQTISIEGGDENEDFALTITGLEDAPEADLTGLTLSLDTLTDTNVGVEVDSTGGVTIGDDADLGITGATSVTLDVTGTGTVDVEDGADLSGIDAFTVAQGSTLVTDSTLAPESSIAPADVTGSGKLQYVELDTGTVAANDEVRTNEFVFNSADTGVTINGFESEVGNGFFVFDDSDPTDPILGTMSLNLSDFDTTGAGFDTIATGATQTDVDGVGVIVVEDGSNPTGLDLSGANNGEDAQLFFAFENGANTEVQYWSDDGTGTGTASDGNVDAGELTLVATLDNTDTDDLGSANFAT